MAKRFALAPDTHTRVLREELRRGMASASPTASPVRFYPIGTPGQKWTEDDKKEWLACRSIRRSYQEEVLSKVEKLRDRFDIAQYGALSHDVERYPLLVVKTKQIDPSKPTVLVTGGVHGYETSGVQGAIRFLETKALQYAETFNIIVAPCVSPWGYETINRWTVNAVDPNRSFITEAMMAAGPPDTSGIGDANRDFTDESAALMKMVEEVGLPLLVHIDLHETTDTDETEFRPAKAARDGASFEPDGIPDGFYLVGNSAEPQQEFLSYIIEAVREVTHIAPADEDGLLIGEPMVQDGVILVPARTLGLCAGLSAAPFAITTEVYPDSPKATDEQCNLAQVAVVTSALDWVAANGLGSKL